MGSEDRLRSYYFAEKYIAVTAEMRNNKNTEQKKVREEQVCWYIIIAVLNL